jgi:hypothetical protein
VYLQFSELVPIPMLPLKAAYWFVPLVVQELVVLFGIAVQAEPE